jgi:hypothetical protein
MTVESGACGASLVAGIGREAVDPGRQASRRGDAAELPSVPGERGAAMAERDRPQPGKPLAAARAAEANQHLVADESAATARENGWPVGQTRPVLVALAKGYLTRTRFGAILRRLTALSVPAG